MPGPSNLDKCLPYYDKFVHLLRLNALSVPAGGELGFSSCVSLPDTMFETINVDGFDKRCSGGVYPRQQSGEYHQ